MTIAILLLGNYGDILYATALTKQIKELDYPGCKLIWIVDKHFRQVLSNNPYIDEIEDCILDNVREIFQGKWESTIEHYRLKEKKEVYDKLFILQPYDFNFLLYRNSIRQMVTTAYEHTLQDSGAPLIFLAESEKARTLNFIEKYNIRSYTHRVLVEFSPSSGQSVLKAEDFKYIVQNVVSSNDNTCVIMSGSLQFESDIMHVYNAQELSFIENAELINHCTLLVGCSSGISWLSTSKYCKPIFSIQYVSPNVKWFNSLKADHIIHGIGYDHIIELYKFDKFQLVNTINCCLGNGFNDARLKYDQQLMPEYLLTNLYTISDYMFFKKKLFWLIRFTLMHFRTSSAFRIHNAKLIYKVLFRHAV